ncbi:hypothetical protein ElyMa_001210500 [Elysia marginata]|uniref:Uncharacterized protein n=1 Tax=Elysia marginata TaxID=1093978 RepID=A0AAV4I8P0_9GAST|nr:hypothetical protein ElyMa_001210500 [Elysia marginata]
MPAPNCTVFHLILPVVRHLNLTQVLALLNDTQHRYTQQQLLPLDAAVNSPNSSSSVGGGVALTSEGHNLSARSLDAKNDAQGAVKFTVAVVLLYGECSERDATRLVQNFHRDRSRLDRQYHKAKIESLVRNIHADNLTEILISGDKCHQGHQQTELGPMAQTEPGPVAQGKTSCFSGLEESSGILRDGLNARVGFASQSPSRDEVEFS